MRICCTLLSMSWSYQTFSSEEYRTIWARFVLQFIVACGKIFLCSTIYLISLFKPLLHCAIDTPFTKPDYRRSWYLRYILGVLKDFCCSEEFWRKSNWGLFSRRRFAAASISFCSLVDRKSAIEVKIREWNFSRGKWKLKFG